MSYSLKLREEELKNKVAEDYFKEYDRTKIIGNIDFCISKQTDKSNQLSLEIDDYSQTQSFLWAESKRGNKNSVYNSLVQLILTIGKARTFEKHLPPIFLGAFDAEKIAFIEYEKISEIFNKNDFNWNVVPSNHNTKEFKEVLDLVGKVLKRNSLIFNFSETDDSTLRKFIKKRFVLGKGKQQITVTKNNFTSVYYRWREKVKDTINIDWEKAKAQNILDSDFYLADLLSRNNESLKESLYVLLKKNRYIYARVEDDLGGESFKGTTFKDGQVAHNQFWNIYRRPPRKEFWNYIIERRDLLVPQDVREIKGSYFTPSQWVELSQEYIEKAFGENWQDEYVIWDCCAGTGNLLNGLTNKYNIFASTLDKADVDVMKERINNGANLLESQVFQFDFLNDDFYSDKVPKDLQDILKDPEKRKKLVIYINPPYAEGDNRKGVGRSGVAESSIWGKYSDFMGYAKREIYIQFFTRIYNEIPNCKLGIFSTITNLQGVKFRKYRENFKAKLLSVFLAPAYTFDNVKGKFPIAFQIYDLSIKECFKEVIVDVYDNNADFKFHKKLVSYDDITLINDWTLEFVDKEAENKNKISIDTIIGIANDFQNQSTVRIEKALKPWNHQYQFQISDKNLLEASIYFTVRKIIPHIWIDHYDQFCKPNYLWYNDDVFKSDCLAYTIFDGKNRVSLNDTGKYWIPFTEKDVDSKGRFESHFMTDYIKENNLVFSNEAKSVFDAGKELYRYYHMQKDSNPNASFYDIRLYFQGVNDKGNMNSKSSDSEYTRLLANLRKAHKTLAKKIQPKVFEYGFLL